jgi:hypothetical protein
VGGGTEPTFQQLGFTIASSHYVNRKVNKKKSQNFDFGEQLHFLRTTHKETKREK